MANNCSMAVDCLVPRSACILCDEEECKLTFKGVRHKQRPPLPSSSCLGALNQGPSRAKLLCRFCCCCPWPTPSAARLQDVQANMKPATIVVYIVFGFLVVNVFFLNLLIGEESGALMKQLGVIFNAIIALVTFVGCVNRWVRDSVSFSARCRVSAMRIACDLPSFADEVVHEQA